MKEDLGTMRVASLRGSQLAPGSALACFVLVHPRIGILLT
jgi:hypothetical protein